MNRCFFLGGPSHGGMALLLIALVGIVAQTGGDAKSPSQSRELAETALKGSGIDDKERAAVDLSLRKDSDTTEMLLKVLKESKDSGVLVAVINGLAERAGPKADKEARECMPQLVKILEDDKGGLKVDDAASIKRLRGGAYQAIARITGADFGWNPEADQDDDDQKTKLRETLALARFYIKNPPPGK